MFEESNTTDAGLMDITIKHHSLGDLPLSIM